MPIKDGEVIRIVFEEPVSSVFQVNLDPVVFSEMTHFVVATGGLPCTGGTFLFRIHFIFD